MAGKQQPVTNPRIVKLMELEAAGRIKPEHQTELDSYRSRGIVSAPNRGILAFDEDQHPYARLSAFITLIQTNGIWRVLDAHGLTPTGLRAAADELEQGLKD